MEYIKNVTYTEYLTTWTLEGGGPVDITIADFKSEYNEKWGFEGTQTKLFEAALEHILHIPPVVVTEIEYLTCARDPNVKIYRVEFQLF